MIVYHGSDVIVKNPDILHSKKHLDFGNGFYVTNFKEQAERWAKRKAIISRKNIGIVNVYEMMDKLKFNAMNFGDSLEEWIDFVCACQNGELIFKKYDIIQGKVADDKVFRVVDMYKRGIWDKKRAIDEIRVYETYEQVAFISQKAIDEMLKFKESFEVKV